MENNIDKMDFSRIDKSNLYGQIENFFRDCEQAWQLFSKFEISENLGQVKKVVLLGMGGSGIANQVIKELLAESTLCLDVVRDYSLPGCVDGSTLVIASSYSGNTEETVQATRRAAEKGAKIIVISTGGQIEVDAKENGWTLLHFDFEAQPRMAFSYLLMSLLAIFQKIGYLADDLDPLASISESKNIAATFLSNSTQANNEAKQIAVKVAGKLPVVYASANIYSMGLRLKNQINENAKSIALFDFFPELNHNAVEGYDFPKSPIFILSLESSFAHERIILRQSITEQIWQNKGLEYARISFSGCSSRLSEYLVLSAFCDALTFYMAMLNNTDPTEIPQIRYLKSKL